MCSIWSFSFCDFSTHAHTHTHTLFEHVLCVSVSFSELALSEGLLYEMWQKHGGGLHGLCHQPVARPSHRQLGAAAAATGERCVPSFTLGRNISVFLISHHTSQLQFHSRRQRKLWPKCQRAALKLNIVLVQILTDTTLVSETLVTYVALKFGA